MVWTKKNTQKPYQIDPSLEVDININRPAYNQEKFEQNYNIKAFQGFSILYFFRGIFLKNCSPEKKYVRNYIVNRIPIIGWLSEYNFREFLVPDLFAGITVGIMHIPQGMGYALLAELPPIYGLYTSFFPSLIYLVFGTSRQLSIGTLAITCIMVGTLITDLEKKIIPDVHNSTVMSKIVYSHLYNDDNEKIKIQIATASAFCIGIIQIIMFIFQLGFITAYFSEPMLNGFVAGYYFNLEFLKEKNLILVHGWAPIILNVITNFNIRSSIHVLTSQIKSSLGISIPVFFGVCKIPITWYYIIMNIPKANLATVIISVICITKLLIIKIHVNQRFAKKMIAPFPTELVVVIDLNLFVVFGTLISYLANFKERFDIKIIGPVQSGIPSPESPPLYLLKDMIFPCFLIAIVTYAINFSLCDLFSKTHHYKINPNQEFLAYGASNVFSSFFSCFVSAGSLGRSCMQNNAGGKTQMASVFSCIILALVLGFIAPLFEYLPKACLASIVIVALQGLFIKIGDLVIYWKINKIEFFQFLITFLSVVFLDIDIGLGIGVGFYILIHLVRSSTPYSTLLGNIPGTEFYKDTKLYKEAKEIDQIKIVRIQAELHASNSSKFQNEIFKLTDAKPQDFIEMKEKIVKEKRKIMKNHKLSKFKTFFPSFMKKYSVSDKSSDTKVYGLENQNFENSSSNFQNATIQIEEEKTRNFSDQIVVDDEIVPNFKFLIIDCSPIPFIDSVGVKTIKQLISDYKDIGIITYLADCNDAIIDRFKCMEHALSTEQKSAGYYDERIFHLTIHDAVVHAQNILNY
ncbi:solute carrier family 26 member 6-like [Brachionus plicatilis]|uniref:Solute carrier family 26 member 6-like n=1 Tax=Brachionus plicatilis TaxID=10195 RepID=A0A3M7QSZ1_BRAPC|nr:solute carrier family 26 member 6-like [Brachionus plicatilis]